MENLSNFQVNFSYSKLLSNSLKIPKILRISKEYFNVIWINLMTQVTKHKKSLKPTQQSNMKF
jgi:hypothetical protein